MIIDLIPFEPLEPMKLQITLALENPCIVHYQARYQGPPLDDWPLHPLPLSQKDGLWQTSCMELFAKSSSHTPYLEWNLSPRGYFAYYEFSHYRKPQPSQKGKPLFFKQDQLHTTLEARLPLPLIPANTQKIQLHPCAVLSQGGTLSYWAMSHGPQPDFHHPSQFQVVATRQKGGWVLSLEGLQDSDHKPD